MRAGGLRHLVTVQKPVTTSGDYGEPTTVWVEHATAFAEISQLKAYDKSALATTWPGADYSITIRYIAGVTGNMRVLDSNGGIYSILGEPNNVDGRNREIILTCQKGVKVQ